MKWKALIILLLILGSLIPAYLLNKFLQKIIKPRQSLSRLLLYLLSGMLLVFFYTLLLVFIIKLIFPSA